MPSWNQVLQEIQECRRVDALDYIRRSYLSKLHDKRERNIICYYSGWLQKPGFTGIEIDDNDKNALMSAVHQLDRGEGLDLILHTPGGQVAATESLVHYLRTMFGSDIQAFVPQIAMSAGTMIACACQKIFMGKQSNLGPIDPQFSGIAAREVLNEFRRAVEEIKEEPARIPLWQTIIGKYHPTFIGECENAVAWAQEIVERWLLEGMFQGRKDAKKQAERIVRELSDHSELKSHSRHLHKEQCKEMGLEVVDLETDQELQDLVLTVHHAFMHTFAHSPAIKIVENHLGIATVINITIQK